ncbi:MAG: LysM peptidoglycan-binding domain-containing protein [Planctomycetaceae bacterium]|jgi:nucleoid-associated protein YgaU|nr:LysM peptidoglycan-binding domain-containing protein [Planctomycetaceae bacterium]
MSSPKPLPLPIPLPLPTPDESHKSSLSQFDSEIADDSDNATGLTALLKNASIAKNDDKTATEKNVKTYENKDKTPPVNIKNIDKTSPENPNEKNTFIKNTINIITQLTKKILHVSKQTAKFSLDKLSTTSRNVISLLKKIPSYFVIKIDDEIDDLKESATDNKSEKIVINTTTKNNPKPEKNPTENSATKNHDTKPQIPAAVDLYGEDNDIYEGFSWQGLVVKIGMIAVVLLLFVAGYIGVRSIFNSNSTNSVAIKDGVEDDLDVGKTRDKTDANKSPDKIFEPKSQNDHRPNNSTLPPPSNHSDQHAKLPNVTTPPADFAQRESAPAMNIPNSIADNNSFSTNSPLPNPNNSFGVDSNVAKEPSDNTTIADTNTNNTNLTNTNLSDTAKSNSPIASDSDSIPSDSGLPSLPFPVASAFPAAQPEALSDSPSPSIASAAVFPETVASELPTNTVPTNAVPTNAVPATASTSLPLSDFPASDSPLAAASNIPFGNNPTDTLADNSKLESAPDAKSEQNVNLLNTFDNQPKLTDNNLFENDSNKTNDIVQTATSKNRMVPLVVTAENSPTTTSSKPKNTDGKKETAKEVAKETPDIVAASTPMETLKKEETNVLTNANSVPLVPAADHKLTPNQSIDTMSTDAAIDKSIYVAQNKDAINEHVPAIAPENIQSRFAASNSEPPTLEKSDFTMPKMTDDTTMKTISTTFTKESAPTIPTSNSPIITTNQPFQTESTTNEPTPRIPDESASIAASKNHTHKTPTETNTSETEAPLFVPATNQPAAAPDKLESSLVFENKAPNNNVAGNTNNTPNVGATVYSATNNNPVNATDLLPMPTDVNDANVNPLASLLPSNADAVTNPSAAISREEVATFIEGAPQAVIAESNQGYQHLPTPRNPATIQMKNTGTTNNRTLLYREELDREITKSPEDTLLYTVQTGDTYMSICDKFYGTGLLYRALAVHNRNRGAAWIPAEGTQIEIPTAAFLKTNYENILARNNRYNRKNITQNNNIILADTSNKTASAPNITTQSTGIKYIVQKDDSVFKIAQEQLKDTTRWKEIIDINADKLRTARDLKPGMEIILPTSTASGRINLN